MKKIRLAKWMIIFSYLLIPLFAFSYKFYAGNSYTKLFYDFIVFILLFLFFVSLLQEKKKKISKNAKPLLMASFLMSLILFISYFIRVYEGSSAEPFYLAPFIFELKLPIYLLIIGFAYVALPPLDISHFVYWARGFSCILIIDVLIRFLLTGALERPTIVSESNYDGVFVLLGLIALFSDKKEKYFVGDYLLFLIATLLTQSKTGLGCFIVISFIHFSQPGNLKYFFFFLFSVFAGYLLLLARLSGIDDIEKIDRFAMWFSFIELLNSGSWQNILLGYFPGFSIRDTDPFMWWFIENQSEKLGAQGLHAFNYHSFWLRLAATYGVIFSGVIVLYFINFARKGRSYLYFSILVLLQGFSMGLFYLSVNVLMLSMYYSSLLAREGYSNTYNL